MSDDEFTVVIPGHFSALFAGLRMRFSQLAVPDPDEHGVLRADPGWTLVEHFKSLTDVVSGVATVWEALHVSGSLDAAAEDLSFGGPDPPPRYRCKLFYLDDMLTYDICEHINASVPRDPYPSDDPSGIYRQLVQGLLRIASLCAYERRADITKRIIDSIYVLVHINPEAFEAAEVHLSELAKTDDEAYRTLLTYWEVIEDALN